MCAQDVEEITAHIYTCIYCIFAFSISTVGDCSVILLDCCMYFMFDLDIVSLPRDPKLSLFKTIALIMMHFLRCCLKD